ncbi:MAG: LysR family transcriptional regulator [Pseudodesulfovibrio sp.]|uniref:LysR family transcriptional regulator n=1 Tax=Pseudodesulfovibrio sp. TaxID=2035812 RepID=UPI003D0EB8D5
MDLKNLLYFKTIVEQGQISRAARVLHISQPPLSKRLKELEDDVGTTLIERTGQNWVVTTAGKAMYKKALQILDLTDSIPSDIRQSGDEVAGKVTLGCTTLTMALVRRFIPSFCHRHTRAELRVIVEDSTILEQKLREHALDFCIMLTPRSPLGLELTPLPASPPCVVVPPCLASETIREAFARKRRLPLAALHRLPLTIFRRYDGGGLYNQVMSTFISNGVSPATIMDCPDCSTMLDILEEGLKAVAIVPRSEVPERMYKAFLVCDLPRSFPLAQPLIARLEDRYLPRAARAFRRELLAFAETVCSEKGRLADRPRPDREAGSQAAEMNPWTI